MMLLKTLFNIYFFQLTQKSDRHCTFHFTMLAKLERNGCFRCCCGVGCAACWIFIGIWAIIMLGILAILFSKHKQGNIGDFKRSDSENATTLLITVIIYFVLTIFCSWNLRYRLKNPFPPKDGETKEDPTQVAQIGSIQPDSKTE